MDREVWYVLSLPSHHSYRDSDVDFYRSQVMRLHVSTVSYSSLYLTYVNTEHILRLELLCTCLEPNTKALVSCHYCARCDLTEIAASGWSQRKLYISVNPEPVKDIIQHKRSNRRNDEPACTSPRGPGGRCAWNQQLETTASHFRTLDKF